MYIGKIVQFASPTSDVPIKTLGYMSYCGVDGEGVPTLYVRAENATKFVSIEEIEESFKNDFNTLMYNLNEYEWNKRGLNIGVQIVEVKTAGILRYANK